MTWLRSWFGDSANLSVDVNQQSDFKNQEEPIPGGCPVLHSSSKEASSANGCPVLHDKNAVNPLNLIPTDLDASKTVDPSLSAKRQLSSIPRTQSENDQNWVYPSEQQFFQALQRKGKETDSKDVAMIVHIHNEMNEKCWEAILQWEERLHGGKCCKPRLARFRGRPDDLTPKARVLNWLGWAPLPFDRHDWIVDRCGKEVRYVIDYYHGKNEPGVAVFHVDARPAVDDVDSFLDRVKMWWMS